MIRDLTADLMRRTADATEMRIICLELTAQAESTLREPLERARADRLEAPSSRVPQNAARAARGP